MPRLATGEKDLPLVYEGMRNFAGGEDSFRDPIELDPNQCQKLVNVIVRDKLKARTRPGADALADESTSTPGGANPVQGLAYFDTPALEYLVAAINGHLYTWNGSAWSSALAWNYAGSRVTAAQGVDKMLFADGSGNCQQWDGTTFTDLGDTNTSPPKGATIVLWHAGRMWAMGTATAPDTVYASALLDFGPGQWNRTDWSFRVGGGEGDPIRAAASIQGFTMAIGKENSVWLVETDPQNIPTDYNADQASETVSYGVGICGRDAWCVYGNDLLFVSPDLQIRSLRRMAAAAGQWDLSAPLSEPVQPYIDRINPNYTHLIAVTKYLEFAFFAVPLDSSTVNNSVMVWNGRLGRWLGVWEGWTPAVWCVTRFSQGIGTTGVSRLVFGDNVGRVNLWKDREATDDADTYTDNGDDYATKVWTRSMVFGDLESPKTGFSALVRFNMGEATINFTGTGSDADLRTWSDPLEPTGSILGGSDVIGESGNFTLASDQPSLLRGSLRGLPSFSEFYLKIESTAGWWELRNLTCSARVHPVKIK